MNERFEQMIDQVLKYKPPSKEKKAVTQTAAKKRKRRAAKNGSQKVKD